MPSSPSKSYVGRESRSNASASLPVTREQYACEGMDANSSRSRIAKGEAMKKMFTVRFVLASVVTIASVMTIGSTSRASSSEVSFTGLITCSHCLDLSQHKGFTPWSWATYSVSRGDDIVLATKGKTFNLQGDRKQLSKYIGDKVIVSGNLDANTIAVRSVTRPAKR
jgi:hypothetical protein